MLVDPNGTRLGKNKFQDWATPQPLFDVLNAEYKFTVDVCASAWNAKLPRFYTRADDALSKDWSGERWWCNPPYKEIKKWLAYGWEMADRGGFGVYLVPMSTDTEWYHDYGYFMEQHIFKGRISFERPAWETAPISDSPGFASQLLIVGGDFVPGGRKRRLNTGVYID